MRTAAAHRLVGCGEEVGWRDADRLSTPREVVLSPMDMLRWGDILGRPAAGCSCAAPVEWGWAASGYSEVLSKPPALSEAADRSGLVASRSGPAPEVARVLRQS